MHKFVKAWRQKRGRKCDLDEDDPILPASKRAKQAARPSRKRPRADDDGSPIAATAAEVAAVARAFAADIEYGADPDDGSDVTAKVPTSTWAGAWPGLTCICSPLHVFSFGFARRPPVPLTLTDTP